MTLARRMWLAFGLLLLIVLTVGAVAYLGVRSLPENLQLPTGLEQPTAEATEQMQRSVAGTETAVLEYLETRSSQPKEQIEGYARVFEKSKERYRQSVEAPDGKKAIARTDLLYEEYRAVGNDLMARRDQQSELVPQVEKKLFKARTIIRDLQTKIDEEEPDRSKKLEETAKMASNTSAVGIRLSTRLGDPGEDNARIPGAVEDLGAALERYRKLKLTEQEKDRAEELEEIVEETAPLLEKIVSLDASNEEDLSEFLRLRADLDENLGQLRLLERQDLYAAEEAARQATRRTAGAILALLAAGLVVGGVAAAITGRKIVRSVRELAEAASKIATGDFDRHLDVATRDELGMLASALNRVAEERKHDEDELRHLGGFLEDRARRVAELETTTVEPKNDERVLHEEHDGFVMETSRLGLFDWDLRENILYWDEHALDILGLAGERFDPTYEAFLERVHPDDRQRVREATTAHLERYAEYYVTYRVRRPEGGYRTCVSRAETRRDPEGTPLRMIGVICDVTGREALEEQLAHLTLYDSLTGLPNRTLFMDRLGHALLRAQQERGELAVLFMELDNFKVVNDSVGHESGDRLLAAVAERLNVCVRPGDTVARFGSDEFTVILEGTSVNEVSRIAERISEELETPLTIDGHQLFLTSSIGVALNNDSAEERPADLIRAAGLAMHEAKHADKSRYVMFDSRMSARALERLKLESDLRMAIEREEFVVHYQPKVSLETLEVFAFEALVRWNHPRRGLVPPMDFLPLAEETNLIVPIGQWVLKQACSQARSWQERHPDEPPLMVSVNLSPRQLHQPDLVESVTRVLMDTGLAPRSLVLEVTENALVEDPPSVGTTLERLRDLGIVIAIDDFGTAYSSLSRLKQLPVDILKVDRSFVAGLGKDDEDDVLVSGVLNLASGLGLDVIAEGVETSRQLAYLRKIGCTRVQGYYFSRPLPSREATTLLESSHRG